MVVVFVFFVCLLLFVCLFVFMWRGRGSVSGWSTSFCFHAGELKGLFVLLSVTRPYLLWAV